MYYVCIQPNRIYWNYDPTLSEKKFSIFTQFSPIFSTCFTGFKMTWILSFELQQTFTRLGEGEEVPPTPLLIAVTWGGGAITKGLEERVNSSWIITFAVSCGFFASKSFFLCEHKYRKFFDSSVKWRAKDCFESCSMMKESHQHLSLHMSVPSLKFKMKMKVL